MLSHLAEVAVRELESSCMLHWSQMQQLLTLLTQLDEAQRTVQKLVRGLDCFSEGILLCDVEGGWGVRYANSAFTRLTGLGRQQAVGTALWSLFGLPAGGATAADIQVALRSRQPFTMCIGLLPSSAGPAATASSPLQLTSFSSTDVAPPSSPVGSMLMSAPTSPSSRTGPQLETGGLFTATFTPASSPEFRPDEPAISIPIVPPPPGYSSSGSDGSGGSGLEERLWFVTLQRPAGQQGSIASASGTNGSLASGPSPANPISHLRPANMAGVQLGPLLGVGASGRAYRGSWHGTEVCVKILNLFTPLSPTESTSDVGFPAAPLLEAALSKALLHPNIVPTHAWGISEGVINARGQHHSQVWIVQSLCTLGTLAHARDRGLFQDPATQGPDLRAILLTMRDVAAALSYLHSVGVVHGDLSGNNVLLSPSSPDERGFTAMVADFGLARPQGLSPDAVPRGSFGTVPNMPPELLSDDVLSPAADSWAFGTLLWELLSGRRAWRGMGPMQIIAAVTLERRALGIPPHWPQGVKDLVSACLSHNAEARPTAQQILEKVQALLDEGGGMPPEMNGSFEDSS
ncbi:Serine threonine- kinase CTR1 [Chlorella sorokiniana]|uniref:Serine threonine-kinase CTR1 n=1 Tax=Chlorella sorokiniana TaxID=3076 RepID=A0A2P6U4M7_CHLSO|nr:Serine threonine- kinase CTR1 [Chlorella sorokiniana]|eukprot:PRW61273.1 Serine threonine- kinase CTR1 [Chlorella sorokiniana]